MFRFFLTFILLYFVLTLCLVHFYFLVFYLLFSSINLLRCFTARSLLSVYSFCFSSLFSSDIFLFCLFDFTTSVLILFFFFYYMLIVNSFSLRLFLILFFTLYFFCYPVLASVHIISIFLSSSWFFFSFLYFYFFVFFVFCLCSVLLRLFSLNFIILSESFVNHLVFCNLYCFTLWLDTLLFCLCFVSLFSCMLLLFYLFFTALLSFRAFVLQNVLVLIFLLDSFSIFHCSLFFLMVL